MFSQQSTDKAAAIKLAGQMAGNGYVPDTIICPPHWDRVPWRYHSSHTPEWEPVTFAKTLQIAFSHATQIEPSLIEEERLGFGRIASRWFVKNFSEDMRLPLVVGHEVSDILHWIKEPEEWRDFELINKDISVEPMKPILVQADHADCWKDFGRAKIYQSLEFS